MVALVYVVVMPFVSQARTLRTGVAACDGCDGILTHAGTTTDKPHGDSSPDDLAPHYDERGALRGLARDSGWDVDGDRWSCPRCSALPFPPT